MTCLPLALLLDYGIGTVDGGLVPTGTLLQWSYAVPTVRPPGAGAGPVWSTRPEGNTLNDAVEYLTVPLPPLGSATRPVLVIDHATLFGIGDVARFELDTGSGFTTIEPIFGYPNANGFRGDSGGYLTSGIDLTGVPPGSSLRLRFEADASGSGPGWFVRSLQVVDGDPIPPRVHIITGPDDTIDELGPYLVEALVVEDVMLTGGRLLFRADGVDDSVDLEWVGGRWTGWIPAQPLGVDVEWGVEFTDCENTVFEPGGGLRVHLPAPTDLSGPTEPHTVARSVTLDWEPPDTTIPVEGYRLTEIESGVSSDHPGTTAQVALDPSWAQRFEVRALFAAGVGEPSDPLQVKVEVPELLSVEPREVFPGDRVYLTLEGRSLYLLDGASSLGFGSLGVLDPSLVELTVLDVDRARALVLIPNDAPAGPQDIVVTGTRGSFRFSDELEILDAADAPRITLVDPSGLEQGQQVDVIVRSSRAFASSVEITVDEELLLSGDPVVSGDEIRFPLAALGDARPGRHTLVIDDGTRAWEVGIEVTPYRYQGRSTCSSAGSSPGRGWAWLALLATSIIIRTRKRGTWRFHP